MEHIRPNESVLCETRIQATRACSPGPQNNPTPPALSALVGPVIHQLPLDVKREFVAAHLQMHTIQRINLKT
jgi:hypothetical protein